MYIGRHINQVRLFTPDLYVTAYKSSRSSNQSTPPISSEVIIVVTTILQELALEVRIVPGTLNTPPQSEHAWMPRAAVRSLWRGP